MRFIINYARWLFSSEPMPSEEAIKSQDVEKQNDEPGSCEPDPGAPEVAVSEEVKHEEIGKNWAKNHRKRLNRQVNRLAIASKLEGNSVVSTQRAMSYVNSYNSIQRMKCLGLQCEFKNDASAILPCMNCGWVVYCSTHCQHSSDHKSVCGSFNCQELVNMNMKSWKHMADELVSSSKNGPGNEHLLDSSTIIHARNEIMQHVFILQLKYVELDHVKYIIQDNVDQTQLIEMCKRDEITRKLGKNYWTEFNEVILMIDDIKLKASPCTLLAYSNTYSQVIEIPGPLQLCSECHQKKPLLQCARCEGADRCKDCPHDTFICFLMSQAFKHVRPTIQYVQRDIPHVKSSMKLRNTMKEFVSKYGASIPLNMTAEQKLEMIYDVGVIMKHAEYSTTEFVQYLKSNWKDKLEALAQIENLIKQSKLEESKQPGQQVEGC